MHAKALTLNPKRDIPSPEFQGRKPLNPKASSKLINRNCMFPLSFPKTRPKLRT